jgi:hypothetical protein
MFTISKINLLTILQEQNSTLNYFLQVINCKASEENRRIRDRNIALKEDGIRLIGKMVRTEVDSFEHPTDQLREVHCLA